MPGIHDLWLFIVSGLLLNIAPGPDSLLVVTRTAAGGPRAGSAAAFGVGAGCLVHVAAAALGLSALLATSATAFLVVKMIGAAYLVWLGVGMLWPRRGDPPVDATADARTPALASVPAAASTRPPLGRIFLQGLGTNVLNPKVALFFLAFVPQFITADAPSKPLAFAILGLVFDVNGLLWLHVLVATTALARRRFALPPRGRAWLDRTVGALFLALGVRLALAQR